MPTPAKPSSASRVAAHAERQRQAGKKRISFWLTEKQEATVRRLLDTGESLDRETLDVIVKLEREAEKWKAETIKLRQALSEQAKKR
jgi:hypothetical protein